MSADPAPAGSGASPPKAREDKHSRTTDDARVITAGGEAYEKGGATVRLGLDATVGVIERLAAQIERDANIIGDQQAEIAKLQRKLGKHRKKEKGTEATVHALDVRGDVDKLRIRELSKAWEKLSDHALPVLLPECLPLVRRLVQYADKILPEVTATAARADGAAMTPKAAAMRLFAKLYAPPDEDDEDGVSFGGQVLSLLRKLASEDDWPLVQEYLVSMMAQPTTEPAPAPH